MGGKGGVGWGNNVHWCQLEHPWTGIFSCTHVMLRSGIFSCTSTHTSCYALASSLALAHTHTHVMLRSGIFSCTCTHTRHATLWDLLLHLHTHTHVMLRSGIFSCTCTHTSCYALASSLALAHTRHALMAQSVEYRWHHRHLHAIHEISLPMSNFNVPNHTRNAMKNMFFVIPKLVSDAVIFNTEMNERYVNNESMMISQKNNMKLLVSYYFTTICKTLDPSSTKTSCSPGSKRRAGF